MSNTIKKPYTGAKAVGKKCREKKCRACESNKTHANEKKLLSSREIFDKWAFCSDADLYD